MYPWTNSIKLKRALVLSCYADFQIFQTTGLNAILREFNFGAAVRRPALLSSECVLFMV